MTALPPLAMTYQIPAHPPEGVVDSVLDKTALTSIAYPLDNAVTTVGDLLNRKIPPRRILMEPFIREGNLGFIYGVRGHGKTWIALIIATILTSGTKTERWKSAEPVPTLLIDGEVDLDETQDRLRLLEADGTCLQILHHQDVFDRSKGDTALNLADPEQQDQIMVLCQKRGIKVLILDNLSSLVRGLSENEGDDWEQIGHWLLDLRRLGIAVIIVHHAGRNGCMRGHSRREDAAHWIVKVEKADSEGPDVTAFTVRFEKCRSASIEAVPLLWEIKRVSADLIAIKCEVASDYDVLVQHVLNGEESASDIAALLGVSKGQVSKLAKRAANAGLIKVVDGKYKPPYPETKVETTGNGEA